jgi:very-short-patch-repair endonuclease
MAARLSDLLAGQGGVLTRAELSRAGIGPEACRWAVSTGALVRVAPGVFADAGLWSAMTDRDRHLTLLETALLRAGEGAVAAAASAAVVWRLPLQSGPPLLPIVLNPRSRPRREDGRRSGSGVRRRAWLEPDECTAAGGLPVTTAPRTVVDLARAVPVTWGLAVADVARRRGTTAAELDEAVERQRGVPGIRAAARVASWADPRAESPLESVARATVRMLGLPAPELQVSITAEGHRYRVDLLIREYWTVVEVDGKVKYAGESARPDQAWQDKLRRDRLMSAGFEVERFVAADAYHPRRWGRRLLNVLHRAAARHGLAEVGIDPAFPGLGADQPGAAPDAGAARLPVPG